MWWLMVRLGSSKRNGKQRASSVMGCWWVYGQTIGHWYEYWIVRQVIELEMEKSHKGQWYSWGHIKYKITSGVLGDSPRLKEFSDVFKASYNEFGAIWYRITDTWIPKWRTIITSLMDISVLNSPLSTLVLRNLGRYGGRGTHDAHAYQ